MKNLSFPCRTRALRRAVLSWSARFSAGGALLQPPGRGHAPLPDPLHHSAVLWTPADSTTQRAVARPALGWIAGLHLPREHSHPLASSSSISVQPRPGSLSLSPQAPPPLPRPVPLTMGEPWSPSSHVYSRPSSLPRHGQR